MRKRLAGPAKQARESVFRDFLAGEVRDVNNDERSFSHSISDESVDAHGSIIKAGGWMLDRFKKNPVVLLAHNSYDFPVGRSLDVHVDGDRLMARSQFAGLAQAHPVAETAFALCRDGFIRGWSVGFRPVEFEPRTDLTEDEKWMLWDPNVYTKQELLEYSLVPIPSNPNALNEAKSRGLDIAPLLGWVAERKELCEAYSRRGICLPGVNDGVSVAVRGCDVFAYLRAKGGHISKAAKTLQQAGFNEDQVLEFAEALRTEAAARDLPADTYTGEQIDAMMSDFAEDCQGMMANWRDSIVAPEEVEESAGAAEDEALMEGLADLVIEETVSDL